MNFDRVADIYDATRGLPEGVADKIAERVVEATGAGPDTRFLELGIGTGRIALPFLQRGYRYTGVDISDRMVDRLRAKAPGDSNLTVIQADVTALPLPDRSYDVALMVHLLHLVPEWRTALREIRRVLVPNGYIVLGNDGFVSGTPLDEIRQTWKQLVQETGTTLRADNGSLEAVLAELTEQGARISVYRVAAWVQVVRPREVLEEQLNRVFSLTWSVPDDVLLAVHDQMVAWAQDRFESLDEAIEIEREVMVAVSWFPDET